MTNTYYLNGTLAEIAELPEKNIYHFILSRIEQRVNAGEITEDQESEMQLKLIADYEQAQRLSRKITVIDSIMGSGKSSWAIDYINSNPDERFICVLPLLEEIERYRAAIQCEFFDPEATYKSKKKGADGGKVNKQNGLQELIEKNENILTTHALIGHINAETIELLRERNYTLIIDECLDVVHRYADNFKKADLKTLLKSELARVGEDGFLQWNDKEQDHDGKYEKEKNLCNLHALMLNRNDAKDQNGGVLIWCFPAQFFDLFERCFILTYLFEGNYQATYFKMRDIRYTKKAVVNGEIVPYDRMKEQSERQALYNLITFHDSGESGKNRKYSVLSDKRQYSLSSTWYKSRAKNTHFQTIKKSMENYFINIVHSQSKNSMWTCYKDYKNKVIPKGYKNSFVAWNVKGTNKHADRKALAYMINLFPDRDVVVFFESYNFFVNEDLYALSEMLQWIWRSRIRNGMKIDLYIPSQRMRELIDKWRDCEI